MAILKPKVLFTWTTKDGHSWNYEYDAKPGETLMDMILRDTWQAGIGCALSSQETAVITIHLLNKP